LRAMAKEDKKAEAKAGAKAEAKPAAKAAAKAGAKAEAKAGAKAAKGKAAGATGEEVPHGILAKLRPRKRVIFFVAFMAMCAGIVIFHNPCDVAKPKRQDCGYPDITPGACRSIACLTKGGGSATAKKVVQISRTTSETLGLDVKADKVIGWLTVVGIDDGAVKEHNAALPEDSDERVRVGDRIAKIDSTSAKGEKKAEAAHKRMLKAVNAKGSKTVQVEIQRPRLPSFLMWIRQSNGKATLLEQVLTSPGVTNIKTGMSYIGGVGLACWLLSGYPAASLPLYYGGTSAAVALWSFRCCHDDDVPAGMPHCYKPNVGSVQDVVVNVQKGVLAFVAKVRKNPVAYFKKLVW